MDVRRLRAGEWLTAAGGLALLVSLWLPWWRAIESGYFGRGGGARPLALTDDLDAWEVFSVADVLFAALGALALATCVLVAVARTPGPGLAAEALLTLLALPMAVVAAVQVLGTPASLEPLPDFGVSAQHGAWLGLVATFAVLAGLLAAMRDERLSRPGRLTDQTGRPVDAPVDVERLPAPPPA